MVKDNDSKIHAIFSIKPIKTTNKAIIKCVGHIKEGETIADEPIKTQNGSDDDYVYRITDTIFARFFRSYIQGSYLMTTKTQPVIYASIMYKEQLVGGLLCNIFLDFTISSSVQNEKQLINNNLEGKYSLRIKLNKTDPPKIMDFGTYDSDEYAIDVMKSILDTKEMAGIIAKMMEERKRERIEKLGSMDDIEIPKPKYNFTELVKQYRATGSLKGI